LTTAKITASLLSTTLLSARSVVPAAFTIHVLPTTSLTSMTPNQAHASTSPDPWLNHHSNRSCWDGGLTWLTLNCNPSSLAASRIRQKVRQGVRNRFRWIPPRLGRRLCTHAPRPPRRKRGLALLRMSAERGILTQVAPYFLLGNHLVDA
jgi:hypothetical protein